MSRTRTASVTHFPARVRPFWKLSPSERIARGLCQYCGAHDPQGTHFDFGCNKNSGSR